MPLASSRVHDLIALYFPPAFAAAHFGQTKTDYLAGHRSLP